MLARASTKTFVSGIHIR